MRKRKEVLQLHLTAKLSNRKIALVTGVGESAVSKHLRRARALGLDWSRIEAMDEEAISALLYAPSAEPGPTDLVEPDWNEVSRELRRKKRVTELLLCRASVPSAEVRSRRS